MVKKFKKDEISEHGIYEVRLHSKEDGKFIEKFTADVLELKGHGLIWDVEDLPSSVEGAYEDFILYQRKIGELEHPYAWFED